MDKPFICYGRRKRQFEIPPDWKVLTYAGLHDAQQDVNVRECAVKALEKPIAAPRLNRVLSPSDQVAIIVEDLTRASPKEIILDALLAELDAIHIPDTNISVVIALGTHRPLTSGELEMTFGNRLLDRYRFVNHDCHAADLVPAGRLSTGRDVRINRRVSDATFRIGIGSIFPHPMNGFGGGGKILFPGVADFDSILEHHLAFTFHPGTGPGRIEGNLFYEQVSQIARSAKLNYILNSVLNRNDAVYDVVSGDPVQAHLAGIRKSKGIISRHFSRKSDLTLITSFPYCEGPQIFKPLSPASMVTKEGACIILAADCSGNLPDAFVDSFEGFHAKYGERLYEAVLEHFENKRLIMEGGAIDFNMALAMTLAIQHRFKIILVSKDIPREVGEKMGFIYAEDLQEAFDLSATLCPPNPEVHIIPSGGVILPIT